MQPSQILNGDRSGEDFCKNINAAYEVVSLWRKTVFKLPSNATGKKFVQELVKLNWAYADRTPLERIADGNDATASSEVAQ